MSEVSELGTSKIFMLWYTLICKDKITKDLILIASANLFIIRVIVSEALNGLLMQSVMDIESFVIRPFLN